MDGSCRSVVHVAERNCEAGALAGNTAFFGCFFKFSDGNFLSRFGVERFSKRPLFEVFGNPLLDA